MKIMKIIILLLKIITLVFLIGILYTTKIEGGIKIDAYPVYFGLLWIGLIGMAVFSIIKSNSNLTAFILGIVLFIGIFLYSSNISNTLYDVLKPFDFIGHIYKSVFKPSIDPIYGEWWTLESVPLFGLIVTGVMAVIVNIFIRKLIKK